MKKPFLCPHYKILTFSAQDCSSSSNTRHLRPSNTAKGEAFRAPTSSGQCEPQHWEKHREQTVHLRLRDQQSQLILLGGAVQKPFCVLFDFPLHYISELKNDNNDHNDVIQFHDTYFLKMHGYFFTNNEPTKFPDLIRI